MRNKTIYTALAASLLILAACGQTESNAATTDKAKSMTKEVVAEVKEMAEKPMLPSKIENYDLDIKGAHAFIQFKVKHLGYSWLLGRFNDFDGSFSYDLNNPNNSSINVTIDTNSVDSNHAERDKHLRNEDFLNVDKFPEAKFVSTAVNLVDGKGTVTGDFTFLGVTKELVLEVQEVGHGDDPWGGYRRGFEGKTSFTMKDFGVQKSLGPASADVFLDLHIEGIRQ